MPCSTHAALALAAIFAALGCTHTRPNEMTAEAHRAEAARHKRVAQDEERQYDPSATAVVDVRGPWINGEQERTHWVAAENPTTQHLRAADAELRAASEHTAAAKELEQAENAACGPLPTAERDACPLWRAIVRTAVETPQGVRLQLAPYVDAATLVGSMRCHLAHGRAHGYEGGCPLVVPGAQVSAPESGWIEIKGDGAKSIAAIKEEARRVLGTASGLPPSVSAR